MEITSVMYKDGITTVKYSTIRGAFVIKTQDKPRKELVEAIQELLPLLLHATELREVSNQVVVTGMEAGTSSDGEAWIRVIGCLMSHLYSQPIKSCKFFPVALDRNEDGELKETVGAVIGAHDKGVVDTVLGLAKNFVNGDREQLSLDDMEGDEE